MSELSPKSAVLEGGEEGDLSLLIKRGFVVYAIRLIKSLNESVLLRKVGKEHWRFSRICHIKTFSPMPCSGYAAKKAIMLTLKVEKAKQWDNSFVKLHCLHILVDGAIYFGQGKGNRVG